jgi:hypothetical protein
MSKNFKRTPDRKLGWSREKTISKYNEALKNVWIYLGYINLASNSKASA